VRLVGYGPAGVTSLAKLKGKTIAVSDLNSPGKNFFSVLIAKAGLDPEKDVVWRQFPGDMLGLAVEKGEAQAIADSDPNLFLIERRTKGLVDLASNLSGEYAAKIYSPYSKASVQDLRAVLGTLTHRSHPSGAALKKEVEFYARDFKLVGVLKPGTDPVRFAEHVTVDVLG
jgi:NitT/TauT family transport system substrate-binding protein